MKEGVYLLKKLFSAVWRLFRRKTKPSAAGIQERTLKLKLVEDPHLEDLMEGILYVEARGGKNRWLHMRCPCGCKDVISVNLMTSHHPHWGITFTDETVTLFPSIDKSDGCKSHFFIRNSKVAWAGPTN